MNSKSARTSSEPLGCSMGEAACRLCSNDNPLLRAADWRRQHAPRPEPARSTAASRRGRRTRAARPVDVHDLPTSAAQQQDRALLTGRPGKTRRMDRPKFRWAMVDGEQQRAAEGSDEVAEVPPPELPLAPRAKPDNAGVLSQDSRPRACGASTASRTSAGTHPPRQPAKYPGPVG